jgi:hypothetical protein
VPDEGVLPLPHSKACGGSPPPVDQPSLEPKQPSKAKDAADAGAASRPTSRPRTSVRACTSLSALEA